MTKKTRVFILLICVACFLVIAPVLVLYSMGYRFDLVNMRITATGGIYVRTFPVAELIIVDSKISQKPGVFSNSVFVQSLLPKDHTVLVTKNSYYDYFKTLPVKENQVTKIEDVLLIKKNMQFTVIEGKTQSPFIVQEKFIIENGNLYYSDAPENSGLSAAQKSTPVLKKVVVFAQQNNNIIWLGTDGFIYKSNLASLSAEPAKLILTPIKITKTGIYKILADNNHIFVNNNGNLLLLNAETSEFDAFTASIKDAKISPDGKNIVYYDNNNIYISTLPNMPQIKKTLYKSFEKINNCLWLNNNYIIFNAGNKIVISEIDSRGNINAVTLPQTTAVSADKQIEVKNPKIYFDQQIGKLYILTNDILLLSEKITQ